MFRVIRIKQACALIGLLSISVSAAGVEAVFQVLDSVRVHTMDRVLTMPVDDPRREADFFDPGFHGTDFKACKLTAISGLYCLDGKSIYHWPNPEDPSVMNLAIDCADPVLNLDTKKADTCTGATVDLKNTILIAGKNKGKTFSLIEAQPNFEADPCPPGFNQLATPYCAREVATGRPLLVDITPIDGDFAVAFPFCEGILGLEQRRTAVYFPSCGSPVELKSGKQDFGLSGGEILTGITAIQVNDISDTPISHILVTTNLGRILSFPAVGGPVTPVFDLPSNRATTSEPCNSDDATYGIRASSKSGVIYVTDRQYCELIALEPDADAAGNITTLVHATEPVFDQFDVQIGERNLVLSTTATGSTAGPESPTVSPGISIDLLDCEGSCTLVVGEDGERAAWLTSVELALESTESGTTGMTLFQIKNIPDCRYVPLVCQELLGVPDLFAAGVIVDPSGAGVPQAQLLDLKELMPEEILLIAESFGGLPDMYANKEYRGQKDAPVPFTFEAFVGFVEEGVVFRGIFDGEFDVTALAGSELGCALGLPNFSPLYTTGGQFGTLNWDVINTVSETFVTRVAPAGLEHVTTKVNSGCGTSKMSDIRWSVKPYNMEITPCSYNDDIDDVWASDGDCPVGGPETPDDAVLAKLLLILFDELEATRRDLACTDFDLDAPGLPPLSAADCSALEADWLNAKDKLDKCWDAMQQPKQSSGDQNCQSFISQLNTYENTAIAATLQGPDPANRRSELEQRVRVIRHLYEERVVPSIPLNGFVELQTP